MVIADVLEEQGKALEQELGERALFVRLDVSSEDDWREAVAATLERFGALNILVNNAGILKLAPLLEMSLDDYMAVVHVNQVGCFLGMKIGGRAIVDSGGGSIINTSSIGGLWGIPGGVAYSASKFAVTGMTKTAAIELGSAGVRVNSIHPGFIDTDMVREFHFGRLESETRRERVAPRRPRGQARGYRRAGALPGLRRECVLHRKQLHRRRRCDGWRHGPDESRGPRGGGWHVR